MNTNNGKMLGRTCAVGPGGHKCSCCGQAPGKARTLAKRAAKRSERQAFRKSVSNI